MRDPRDNTGSDFASYIDELFNPTNDREDTEQPDTDNRDSDDQ